MNRYDAASRCEQIKSLIRENQYVKAMEEIGELDYKKIPSISDLYLFADIFLKAEKMDEAKGLYYEAYHRTASRPALYRLLMLTIQMGDIEEAKELYLAYEIVAGITLDTYELRYRLARAEGEPRTKLIEILEKLKEDEYTEKWGFQLAKLYELEGMREKCIEECEELKRWFGEGEIVDKAMALRDKCMSPSWVRPTDTEIPEPITPLREEDPEEQRMYAHPPVQVKEIPVEEAQESAVELKEYKTGRDEAGKELREEPPQETGKSEEPEESPEAAGTEEKEQKTQEETQEAEPPSDRGGFLKRRGFSWKHLVEYFKIDFDSFDDQTEFPEELDTYKQQSTAELKVKEILAEGVDGILEEEAVSEETLPEEAVSEETLPADAVSQKTVPEQAEPKEAVPKKVREPIEVPESKRQEELELAPTRRIPVESLEAQLQEAEKNKKVIRLDDTMDLEGVTIKPGGGEIKSHPLGNSLSPDIMEDVSPNGIHYNTLKGTIYKIHQDEGVMNFALTGGAEGISLAVAKKLFKELKKVNYFEAKNIGKIAADKLNEVNLDEWVERFIGGCMYITDAPSLSAESVKKLSGLIDRYQKEIVIILEGSYDEMDSFLKFHKEFEGQITYKVKL